MLKLHESIHLKLDSNRLFKTAMAASGAQPVKSRLETWASKRQHQRKVLPALVDFHRDNKGRLLNSRPEIGLLDLDYLDDSKGRL